MQLPDNFIYKSPKREPRDTEPTIFNKIFLQKQSNIEVEVDKPDEE